MVAATGRRRHITPGAEAALAGDPRPRVSPLLAVAAWAAVAAGARGAGDERLAARLEAIRGRHSLPAVWAGRFHADGRRVVAAVGVRRLGGGAAGRDDASLDRVGNEKVELDEPVHLGSCTKALTAVLVARGATAGRLGSAATLAAVFPGELPAESPWADVTISSLLDHTSGAPENADWWSLDRGRPGDPVAARRDLLRWLIAQPRPPRPGHRYSNVGYAVAGHALETVEGTAWERLAEREIFEPLDMKQAGFGPLPPPGHEAGAWGHVVRDGELLAARIDNPPPLGPAGRVHATLSEWARFVLAFVGDGGAARRRLGVSPAEWRRLLTPAPGETYAGGWQQHERAWGGGTVLAHMGSNTAWTVVAWAAPRRDFCLLAAVNAGGDAAARACDEAVSACLAEDLLPLAPASPARPPHLEPKRAR